MSLGRGNILLDYAFSDRGANMPLEVADLIGIVSGYIARGKYPAYIEECLSDLLHPSIGAKAARTFEVFEDWQGRNLWCQGPAMEDITFTHYRLKRAFPNFKPLLPDEDHLVNPTDERF